MNNQCPSLGLNTETMPRPVCLKSAIFFRIDAIFFRIDASFLRNSYTNCCYRLNQAKPSSRVQDCSSYLVVKIYFDASYSTAVSLCVLLLCSISARFSASSFYIYQLLLSFTVSSNVFIVRLLPTATASTIYLHATQALMAVNFHPTMSKYGRMFALHS